MQNYELPIAVPEGPITQATLDALAAGFAQAEVIVEDTYFTGAQEHAFLQPEAGLAYLDEQGRITVQVAGQWTHEDQEQIAHALHQFGIASRQPHRLQVGQDLRRPVETRAR